MPLVTLAGIVASAFLYTALRNREIANAVNQLENNCDLKQTEVESKLSGGITLLYAMLAILQQVGPDRMSNDLWNVYAGTLIKEGNWSILSFSRSQLVPLSELDDFEKRQSLRVVRTSPSGDLIPVTRDRPFYLTVGSPIGNFTIPYSRTGQPFRASKTRCRPARLSEKKPGSFGPFHCTKCQSHRGRFAEGLSSTSSRVRCRWLSPGSAL